MACPVWTDYRDTKEVCELIAGGMLIYCSTMEGGLGYDAQITYHESGVGVANNASNPRPEGVENLPPGVDPDDVYMGGGASYTFFPDPAIVPDPLAGTWHVDYSNAPGFNDADDMQINWDGTLTIHIGDVGSAGDVLVICEDGSQAWYPVSNSITSWSGVLSIYYDYEGTRHGPRQMQIVGTRWYRAVCY